MNHKFCHRNACPNQAGDPCPECGRMVCDACWNDELSVGKCCEREAIRELVERCRALRIENGAVKAALCGLAGNHRESSEDRITRALGLMRGVGVPDGPQLRRAAGVFLEREVERLRTAMQAPVADGEADPFKDAARLLWELQLVLANAHHALSPMGVWPLPEGIGGKAVAPCSRLEDRRRGWAVEGERLISFYLPGRGDSELLYGGTLLGFRGAAA